MSIKRERDEQVAEVESKVLIWETLADGCKKRPDVIARIGKKYSIREATNVVAELYKVRSSLASAERALASAQEELVHTQTELQSVKQMNHNYFAEMTELRAELEGTKGAFKMVWEKFRKE